VKGNYLIANTRDSLFQIVYPNVNYFTTGIISVFLKQVYSFLPDRVTSVLYVNEFEKQWPLEIHV